MTVLIGYVPTPEGEAALELGLREAGLRGTDVVVVNAGRRGQTVDADVADDEGLAAVRERAAVAGVVARVEQPQHGADLAETFEDLVEATGADLVVIGLRRRSPVGKLLLGSDAQRILLHSSVPVLAAKPRR